METEIQFIVECPICSERYSANEGRKPRRTGCCDNILCECCINKLCHEGIFRCPHCQTRKQIGSSHSLKVSRETLHFLDALCSLCAECPGSKCSHCMRKLCRFCVAAHKPEVEDDVRHLVEEAATLDERREELGRCLTRLVSAAEQAAASGQARMRRAAEELRAEAEGAQAALDQAERANEMPHGLRTNGSRRAQRRAGRAELAALKGCHERLLQLLVKAEAKAAAAAMAAMAATAAGADGRSDSNEDDDEDEEDDGDDSWESLNGPESATAAGAVATNARPPHGRGAGVTQLLSIQLESPVWCVMYRQDAHSQLLLVESRRVRFFSWNPSKPHEATAERSWSTERVLIRGAVSLMPCRELLLTTWGLDGVMRVDSSGALIAQAGGHGRELGKFRRPYGLAHDGKRRIYVCDTGNNRLQVLLYPMLQAVGCIGEGCLEEPKSVAVDGDRLLATHLGGLAVFSAKSSGLVATYSEGLTSAVPKYGSFLAVHPVSKLVFVSCKTDILAFSMEGYELRKLFEVTLPGRKVRSLATHCTESVLFAETKCAESKERRVLCLRVEQQPQQQPLSDQRQRQNRRQQQQSQQGMDDDGEGDEPGVSQAWSTIKNAVLKALKD